MNLSEQYMGMSEASAFEVSKTSYPSGGYKDEEVINWKADEINKLAKMLGLKQKEKTSYGYGRFQVKGTDVSVDADRNKHVIVVTAGNNYDKRVRVSKLSSKQVANLKAKILNQIQDSDDRQNLNSKVSSARAVLNKAGINIDSGNSMTVDNVNLYYKSGKIESGDSISYSSNVYVPVSGGEKAIDKALAGVKKELVKEQKKYLKAIAKAEKNIDKIKAYYELEASRK